MALNDVPLAGQSLAVTRNPIRQNFLTLGAITGNVNPNSAAVNVASGFNFIFLTVQGANPPAGTAFGAAIGLYNFNNALTAKNELYVHKQNLAAAVEVPMTASFLGNTAAPINVANGWSYLPSGLVIAWGRQLVSVAVPTVINLPFTFPNAVVFASVMPVGLGNSPVVTGQVSVQLVPNGPNVNTFTAQGQGAGPNISTDFFVIGF